jgi:hypothetical protein
MESVIGVCSMTEAEVKSKLRSTYQLVDFDGSCSKMARRLSSSGDEPRVFMDGYLIRYRGAQWFLRHYTGVELYWIPAETVIPDGDLGKLYFRQMTDNEIQYFVENNDPEFMTTWLPNWRSMRCMRWLMNNHPNLR